MTFYLAIKDDLGVKSIEVQIAVSVFCRDHSNDELYAYAQVLVRLVLSSPSNNIWSSLDIAVPQK